jgi:hypothetical protein
VSARTRNRTRSKERPALEATPGTPPPPLATGLRRIPLVPTAITLAVLTAAIFAVDPVRDVISLEPVPEAHLDLSAGYIAIAPLSNVLDTLTLLAPRQHVALILTIVLGYAFYRTRNPLRALVARLRREVPKSRSGSGESSSARRSTPLRETAYAGILLGAILLTYAAAAVLPRPMAAISVLPSDTYFAVDFHSHTSYSHDGRPGWSPADVRNWHRASGFAVAYISDHRTFEGAERGIAENPPQAGEGGGTIILQALEAGWRGEHVNILGAGRVYKGITGADLRDVDEQSLLLASVLQGREPVVIETIPGRPDRMVPAGGPGTAGIRALEIVDGSPRGLAQSRLERAHLLRMADTLNLALVAGSDNHGWGRAAPGWTLMRIPGWRGMSSDSLALAIERTIRLNGRGATRVVERRVSGEMNGTNVVELMLTLPAVTWGMLRTLSADERVMWIVWTWVVALLARRMMASRRRRRLRVA